MSKKRFLRYGRIASLYLCSSVTCSSFYTFLSLSSQGFAAADRTSAAAGVPHQSLFAPVI
ncbi:hypothetical protein [Paenibacillus sp. FSL L8-0708]|uniref:hypothetical protein n=1 Tax=Paenibacillus sp. FSL L8-0708 TaxID=2975311 RepID=UPI0030F6BE6D